MDMNIRYGIGIMAALLVVLVFIFPAVSRDEVSVFPEDLFPDRQRPISLFSHEEHMAFDTIEDCYVCHHVYEDGQLVEGESSDGIACGECHLIDPSPENAVGRLRAYHKRCKGCHESLKTGPITCGECHRR